MNNNTPEFYGYKLGENIAPYINKCIDLVGECYISEGEHIIGRDDSNWNSGNIWNDNSIVWGWNRKHNVKIIGAGRDKTTLKWINNCQSSRLLDKPSDVITMVTTNWNESCNNNLIKDITFDGNYNHNAGPATMIGIRIRGEGNRVEGCRFINFGVGTKETHECFQIIIVPIDKNGKGTEIVNNYFTSPGRKSFSSKNPIPENTMVAVGGVDTIIVDNVFENMDFNVVDQQSPLHAVTISNTKNANIHGNKFINFQGTCIYMDSWTNEDCLISGNIAKDVYQFMQLSCQSWPNEEQISFNKNLAVYDNDIELHIGDCFWHWDKPPFVSNFIGYTNAPNVDHIKHPGFENVLIKDNRVKLGYRQLNNKVFEESTKLHCSWGANVGEDKIRLTGNFYTSLILQPEKKKSFWQKIIQFFKNLFN